MRKLAENIYWTRGLEDLVVRIFTAEIGRVDRYFRWRWGRCLQTRVLLLDFASTFDEGTDEGLCVAVDRCNDVWRDGLGDGLVGNLVPHVRRYRWKDWRRVGSSIPFGQSPSSALLDVDTHSACLDLRRMQR